MYKTAKGNSTEQHFTAKMENCCSVQYSAVLSSGQLSDALTLASRGRERSRGLAAARNSTRVNALGLSRVCSSDIVLCDSVSGTCMVYGNAGVHTIQVPRCAVALYRALRTGVPIRTTNTDPSPYRKQASVTLSPLSRNRNMFRLPCPISETRVNSLLPWVVLFLGFLGSV